MTAFDVRCAKAAFLSGYKSHPATTSAGIDRFGHRVIPPENCFRVVVKALGYECGTTAGTPHPRPGDYRSLDPSPMPCDGGRKLKI